MRVRDELQFFAVTRRLHIFLLYDTIPYYPIKTKGIHFLFNGITKILSSSKLTYRSYTLVQVYLMFMKFSCFLSRGIGATAKSRRNHARRPDARFLKWNNAFGYWVRVEVQQFKIAVVTIRLQNPFSVTEYSLPTRLTKSSCRIV